MLLERCLLLLSVTVIVNAKSVFFPPLWLRTCLFLRNLQKQIVLSTKFPSPGDRFIWQWEIVTPKAGRKVGFGLTPLSLKPFPLPEIVEEGTQGRHVPPCCKAYMVQQGDTRRRAGLLSILGSLHSPTYHQGAPFPGGVWCRAGCAPHGVVHRSV